ncbi:MAG: hypothetical protein KAS72_05335 [Phycisphaerales bacterium]|nr:hypothetical protein [Phycisphaerales bacterium]
MAAMELAWRGQRPTQGWWADVLAEELGDSVIVILRQIVGDEGDDPLRRSDPSDERVVDGSFAFALVVKAGAPPDCVVICRTGDVVACRTWIEREFPVLFAVRGVEDLAHDPMSRIELEWMSSGRDSAGMFQLMLVHIFGMRAFI